MALLKTSWHQPRARNREKDSHEQEAGVKATYGEVLVEFNSFPEALPTEEFAQWFPHCQHAQVTMVSGRSAHSTEGYSSITRIQTANAQGKA